MALEGGFATICVEVAEGILDRDVILTLNTFDILALNGGKTIYHNPSTMLAWCI